MGENTTVGPPLPYQIHHFQKKVQVVSGEQKEKRAPREGARNPSESVQSGYPACTRKS